MPVKLNGATSGSITIDAPAVAGTNTLTLPAVTDTLVGLAATQTLTGKTLTSPTLTSPILTSPTITGAALSAGTASVAPFNLTSGTNLTTATAGAMEYDGTVFYATPTASQRGVIMAEQIILLQAAYTLTSQTAAQKLFNTPASGQVTLTAGTYEFECFYSLTSLSSTSSTFGFALGGTATFTQFYLASADKKAVFATTSSPQASYNVAANTALASASSNTNGYAQISGIINVSASGTIIPQVSLSAAAAAIVGIGAYFRIRPIGSTTVTSVGNWS
jgi:hypothetical protein